MRWLAAACLLVIAAPAGADPFDPVRDDRLNHRPQRAWIDESIQPAREPLEAEGEFLSDLSQLMDRAIADSKRATPALKPAPPLLPWDYARYYGAVLLTTAVAYCVWSYGRRRST